MNLYSGLLHVFIMLALFILSGCSDSDNDKKSDTTILKEIPVTENNLSKKDDINKTVQVDVEILEKKSVPKETPKVVSVVSSKTSIKETEKKEQEKIEQEIIEQESVKQEKIEQELVEKTAIIEIEPKVVVIKRFVRDDKNNIVIDNTTKLQWQDNEVVNKEWVTLENFKVAKYFDTSGDTAITYCDELSLGGYEDWKLPSIEELRTIKSLNEMNTTKVTIFKHISYNHYWSSTPYPGFSKGAWYVNFANGFEFGYGKNIHLNIRCVRNIVD